MKMTVGKMMDATLTIAAIMREKRPMPQAAKFKLARIHAKLFPEFTTANDQREAMIKAYGVPQKTNQGGLEIEIEGQFMVPEDKLPEFNAAWKEIADVEIDLDITPISLREIDLGGMSNGSIEANEFAALGALVTE